MKCKRCGVEATVVEGINLCWTCMKVKKAMLLLVDDPAAVYIKPFQYWPCEIIEERLWVDGKTEIARVRFASYDFVDVGSFRIGEFLSLPKVEVTTMVKKEWLTIFKTAEEITSNTPRPYDKDEPIRCPKCGVDDVTKADGEMGTLVGGEPDPNHYWLDCQCNKCKLLFVRERKHDREWYTEGQHFSKCPPEKQTGKCLLGVSNCFETVIYPCKECGGDLIRRHTALDGVTPVTCLGTNIGCQPGKPIYDYRQFYRCAKCGVDHEVHP